MFRILIFLFLPMMAFSQELSFSVAPKSRIVNYNEDLKSAIDSKKIAVFETYLTNNKKKMDDAVEKINSGKAVVLKPALHYVLEKCISGELDPIWLETYIKKGADIHVDYNGKSILYRLLDNIATTPKTNVKSEVESLKIIYASSKLGIDQNYKSFLQPFSYLLRENYDFLGGKYSADYIPKEVIQFFVDKGANVESYDKVGNGLMTFATQTNQKDIMDYLTSKGINVSKANSDGKDPMYFAIQNNDFAGVEKLIASNYKVIPSLFSKLNLKDISEEKIRNLLANSTLENLVTGDDLLLYVEYFPWDVKKIFQNDFYKKFTIPNSRVVDFVQKIEQSKKPLDGNEREIVLVYKKKYINSLSTLKEVSSAFQQFNFKPIGGYSEDFYTSIDRNNEVLIQSIKNENSYFLPDTKKVLLAEIELKNRSNKEKIAKNEKSKIFYQKVKIASSDIFFAEGDDLNFMDMMRMHNDNYKMKKYNVFVIGQIENNTAESVKAQVVVLVNVKSTSTILGMNSGGNTEGVKMMNILEIPPHSKVPFAVKYAHADVSESVLGVANSSITIDSENPFSVVIHPYFGEISTKILQDQENLISNLIKTGNSKITNSWSKTYENVVAHNVIDKFEYVKTENKYLSLPCPCTFYKEKSSNIIGKPQYRIIQDANKRWYFQENESSQKLSASFSNLNDLVKKYMTYLYDDRVK